MKKKIKLLLGITCLSVFVWGCNQKNLDDFITNDVYRQVDKEKHDKHYPFGHEGETGKKCIYDKIRHKYYCQFPFYDTPQKPN